MRKTIHLTHGAMTVALTGIILLMDRLFMGFFMPFLALPLIVYGSYYSLEESYLVAISNVLIAIILSGMLPTVITSIGYSIVGLSYIYAYKKDYSKKRYYLIMSIFMSLFYAVMVLFFGEYFGIDIRESIEVISGFVKFLNPIIIKILAYLSVVLTMLMEVFIVKVSADMIIYLLHRHRNA